MNAQLDDIQIGEDLKLQICRLVDALVLQDPERYEADFVMMLSRVQDLVERKRRMEGSKTDTRDLLGELIFSRLRRGMHSFVQGENKPEAQRAAEWVMGALFSITTLSELAQAFDHALLSKGSDTDFNFAGRTDFISVEEVMQMLSAGKHAGCLSLEKADNRLDIYLKDGRVVFLDPHHLIRRVMPSVDTMRYRELPEAVVNEAEAQRAVTGVPILLQLREKGHFRPEELREVMRQFGKEVLFDFMRESSPFVFYYRRLDTLPEYATEHDLRLGVTSILLEGSKLVDDWRQMLQVFPDANAPIEPRADMFARMSDVALGVLEIKLLSQINGEVTPRGLVPVLGLPLYDVYQMLVRLAREGIVAPPAGDGVLSNLHMSVEESMQEAFAALDANDDEAARSNALDKVLGDGIGEAAPVSPAARVARSALDRVFGGLDGDGDAGDQNPIEGELAAILKKPRRQG